MKKMSLAAMLSLTLLSFAHAGDLYFGLSADLGFSPGSVVSLGSTTPGKVDQVAPYNVSGAGNPFNLNLAFGLEAGWLLTPKWDLSIQNRWRLMQADTEVSSSTSATYTNGGSSAKNKVGVSYNGYDVGFIAQYNLLHEVTETSRWSVGAGLGAGALVGLYSHGGYGTADWPSTTDSKNPSPTFTYPSYGSNGVVPFVQARIAADWATRPGMGIGFKGGIDVRYLFGDPIAPGSIGIAGTQSSWAKLAIVGQPLIFSPFVMIVLNLA